jgi:hypothetical protein
MSSSQYSSAVVDEGTLAPVSSRQRIPMMGMDLQARYTRDHVELNMLKSGTPTKRQVTLDRPVFDSEQIPQLLRCLPLNQNYHVSLPIFAAAPGVAAEVTIDVVAQERITVPAGTMDCYKVVVSGGASGLDRTFWLTADRHAYIAKADMAGMLEMELSSVTTAEKNKPAYFEAKELGISVSAPAGWCVVHYHPVSSGELAVIRITDPDFNAEGSIWVTSLSQDIAGKMHKEYVVRPESRETITLSGVPAASYIADLKSMISGQDMVEYRFFLQTRARRYMMFFQTDKNSFDQLRPDFDFIVRSLRVE